MFTFFMAEVVSSQRFLRDDFTELAPTLALAVATEISEPAADPAPAEPVELTLFVRDSDAPADTVLFERE